MLITELLFFVVYYSKLLAIIRKDKTENLFFPPESLFRFCFLVEIIECYNNNCYPVFLDGVDVFWAFDGVEYCKLFELLIERNMSHMCVLF